MKDQRISNLARVILSHSLKLKSGESLIIEGETGAMPLIEEIYRLALAGGAHPYVRILVPELTKNFYLLGTNEQLQYVHELEWVYRTKFDARCRILGENNTRLLTRVDPARQKLATLARKELITEALKNERWNVAIFPTNAYAQDAEMGVDDLADLIFAACFCDNGDAIARLHKFNEWQSQLCNRLQQSNQVRIVAKDTDLTMMTTGRKYSVEDAAVNLPSGEIYTGPVENSVNGEIRFTYPVIFNGREISNIWLRFRDGEVVDYQAGKNKQALAEMLSMDPGAKRLGELGIGTNPHITQFCGNLLLDEKISGTIHLALGRSYPETLGCNQSLIHIDMVCELRNGGEVYLDGELFQKDGKFLGEFAAVPE